MLTDDNGVIARVPLGGFIFGEQSDQVGISERQVVADAGAPVRQCDHHAIVAGKPMHLRGTALGAVGQEEQRTRVRGPVRRSNLSCEQYADVREHRPLII